MTGDLRSALDVMSLHRRLGPPWRRLEVVKETGSTNSDLVTRATAGEDINGVVLIAEHQTAGRGRSGRSWATAPQAQVALSVGVGVARVPTSAWGWLPLGAGLAVLDAVKSAGVDAVLKWPNDVLAGEGKLAGILAEVAGQAIVVGIGLNVTLTRDEVGEPLVTSLADLGVADPDRAALAAELLRRLGERVTSWRQRDQQLMADYRTHCATIGSPVRAVLPGGREIVGTAEAVDDEGRLRIDSGHDVVVVAAGDVVHLRPGL
ncbi:MAG: biotin--[acetyl-CoA-carboxylase] ligase [Mycobacteriaceae bacterium]|nr:biotin--[acetyl-CoA-carboxylase] ligase [Mycobacteriaceae bacterium]